ncbi:MAG: hypothetical protein U9O78_04910 [Patescibacteria group bacterium]|nr:hypothetical protein [Patescibacteria group bacterium]
MKKIYHRICFSAWSLSVSLVGSLISLIFPQKTLAADSDFGTIAQPPGVDKYNQEAEIGIIVFMSNIIRLTTVVAGIWAFINFVLAGWIYLTNADSSDAGQKVSQKMINTLMGLLIVVLAYSIAGLFGLLIFGDATYILNPTITTVNDL